MKFNQQELNSNLNQVCHDWDISGNFMVVKNGELLHDHIYGYADRENEIPLTRESKYLLRADGSLLTGLSILILMDQKKIKLTDKLSQYIPEYKHGEQIQIKHMLKSLSGIPDFYYNKLMVSLNDDDQHQNLDPYDRKRIEAKILNENKSFQKVLSLISEEALQYQPGTLDEASSETNWVFLAEIIKRVTNMSLYEFQKEYIFDPLQMTAVSDTLNVDTTSYVIYRMDQLVRTPFDFKSDEILSVTAQDMQKFLIAISTKKLLSNSLWDKALKFDAEGGGLIFTNANGYSCVFTEFLGYGYYMYFNHESGIAFASLVNEAQKFKPVDTSWTYFRKESREVVESAFTYPKETKMVRLRKDNFWDALSIKVDPEQYEFVLEAKASIAMSLLYKSKRAFVEMEGKRAVGLLVLDIDKKDFKHNIDIIQIDKRYQNRGYGKIMLNWAVDYLAKEGAKELEIGVHRENHAAKNIYLAAGFKPKSVNESGMSLHMDLINR